MKPQSGLAPVKKWILQRAAAGKSRPKRKRTRKVTGSFTTHYQGSIKAKTGSNAPRLESSVPAENLVYCSLQQCLRSAALQQCLLLRKRVVYELCTKRVVYEARCLRVVYDARITAVCTTRALQQCLLRRGALELVATHSLGIKAVCSNTPRRSSSGSYAALVGSYPARLAASSCETVSSLLAAG